MRQNATAAQATAAIGAPIANFEGLSNQDNFNAFGFRVNPPDPVGDVGPNHYVEMINLVFAVYSKTGTLLLGPDPTRHLWAGFAVEDCTDPSGDPIVVYDQTRRPVDSLAVHDARRTRADRLQLRRDLDRPATRPARTTATRFTHRPQLPRLPEVRRLDRLVRDHHPRVRDRPVEYGIGVYALEKNKMINGEPNARVVSFFLDGNDPACCRSSATACCRPDIDGKQKPKTDDGDPDRRHAGRRRRVRRDVRRAQHLGSVREVAARRPTRRSILKTQLPRRAFDSIFPCAPTARDCLPQPGITDPTSTSTSSPTGSGRPGGSRTGTSRHYEALVTNQSVEALPGVAGVRWYEIRRDEPATYSRLPAGHVRAGRRRPPLDGLDRAGQERQHGARLQRRQRHDGVPRHPLHGPPRRRPARADDRRARA